MILRNINWESNDVDAMPTRDSFVDHIEDGNAFAVTHQVQLADGSSAELVLDNGTSDTSALIRSIIARGAGFAEIDLKKDTSIDTAGNSEDATPMNIGSGASTSMTVDAGGTYSGGTIILQPMLPGGSGALGSGVNHSSWESAPAIISSGNSGSIVVTNQTGGTEEYELAIVYVEVPE